MRYQYIPRHSWAQWANERAQHRRDNEAVSAQIPAGFCLWEADTVIMPDGRTIKLEGR